MFQVVNLTYYRDNFLNPTFHSQNKKHIKMSRLQLIIPNKISSLSFAELLRIFYPKLFFIYSAGTSEFIL